ncbi:EscT/YscT/HrcT family type III secretion system export apparatus protein [Herbaspirillum seropedicae]|uniref:Type III secretion HprX protein n=1 Tax=Herbaspirillum seropedicae (strain SmR1) TaxID=757424 RepID=D8IZJ5_HERSS|nr:flagellar biosynthetic protein FliR [Herbaspirillum seropedicae]ADJ62315.1 Type III secretion HprX protein [Herbaspirillum seropedicae SmR1]AKN64462.1 type III secretion protein [Herbaspirillum seropedicae]NQE31138.1 type III secretion protein [Herbaspirillum seropedicae]UMU20387.1 EscT/YscT/HrcT family type III secretion system export apparatus protein [Herbaspirillum seropedicae]
MPASLLLDLQAVLVTMALVTPRVLVCLVILPGFGLNVLTGLAKNTAAMAISLPAALPTFLFVQRTAPDMLTTGVMVFKEAMIGLMFGVLMAIPLWVVQSIGSIFDSQRSPIQIQANNATVDRDASAVGALLLQAVVLVMVQAGMFAGMARILIESYAVWPAFTLAPPFEPGHFDVLVKRFGELLWYIVVYGAPVLIPLVLIEFGFAIVGVFASNLQVSFASAPVKSLVGLLIMLLYWSTFSHYVAGDFAHLLDLLTVLMAQR